MIYGFKLPLIIAIAANYIMLVLLIINNLIFKRKYAGKDIQEIEEDNMQTVDWFQRRNRRD